ncbi:MAG: hypothetical protein ACTSO9_13350 [Candidatus Helarchaeota archaeon]
MISTGHLLVSILLIAREIIYPIGAFILIRQWMIGKVRYYTDLPFLFAVAMIIMSAYTFIEIIFVAFYPVISLDSPFGQIAYLIDLNLIALVVGIIFVILLLIWFPKHKKSIVGAIIGWILFTEMAILLAAFVEISFMDMFLVIISLPTYILFVFTFFFCYYHKRLPNVHSLLIGTGMIIIILASLIYPILGQIGTRLAGIYTDATWPAMIIWISGYIVMIFGFIKKAPYSKPVEILD